MKTPLGVPTRRLIVRGAVLVVYLALTAFVFVSGRGHTVLLDNKTAADESYQAFSLVKVYVGDEAGLELMPRDRDKVSVRGQRQLIRIETREAAAVTEKTIRIPIGVDTVLVSLPKMAAGIEPFWEPFVVEIQRATREEDEALPSLDDPVPLD
ncbi:MAG: DUF6672 family protein [Clostridia bacterium]|jgi:hypothetical protein|nr:hypothetical protein [Spirochaetia bacterium]